MLTFKFQAVVPCARCTAYLHGQLFEGATFISFKSDVLQNTATKSKIYIAIFKFGETQVTKIGIQENTYEQIP